MKKHIILFVMLICSILSPVSVHAENPVEDAYTIDTETRALIGASSDDTVIRLHFGYFMYGFSQRQSVEEIFNDGWSLHRTYYIISSTDESGNTAIDCKYVKDGAVVIEAPLPGSYTATDLSRLNQNNLTFYELICDSSRILSALGADVTASKTVYMHGLPHDGMYIYYETSIGNYVYYKDDPSAEDEYLIPLETFYDVAECTQAQRGGSGAGSILSYSDLSLYSLKNYKPAQDQTPTILLWCIPIFLGVCAGVWLLIHKRKQT